MGLLRHAIPATVRDKAAGYINEHVPRKIVEQLPNAISFLGLLCMGYGVKHYSEWRGLAAIVASRACDDIDGDIARKFDATSEAGKLMDAVVNDKFGQLISIPYAFMRAEEREHPVRRMVLANIALKHLTIAGLNGYELTKGVKRDTTREGAVNMGVDSTTFILNAIADTVKNPAAQDVFTGLAVASSAVGWFTGVPAIRSYWPSHAAASELVSAA